MIMVEIWFHNDSYRKTPPFGKGYRPHFVIKGTEEYIGVQFVEIENAPFGEHLLCEVEFLFYGLVDYSKLVPDAKFEIREGRNIVGEGIVL